MELANAKLDPQYTILGVPWIPGWTASIPDLVEKPTAATPGQVYEIKPVGSFVAGAAQLTYYLGILNVSDPMHRKWVRGMSYEPPSVFELPDTFGIYVFAQRPLDGIILYEIDNVPLDIAILVKFAIRSEVLETEESPAEALAF